MRKPKPQDSLAKKVFGNKKDANKRLQQLLTSDNYSIIKDQFIVNKAIFTDESLSRNKTIELVDSDEKTYLLNTFSQIVAGYQKEDTFASWEKPITSAITILTIGGIYCAYTCYNNKPKRQAIKKKARL